MRTKQVEDIYKKKNLHQHILDRPDSYIGSTTITTENRFVYSEEEHKIIKKVVEYNPGLIKIFDEILVNAIDHSVRDNTMTYIKVDLNKELNMITVCNNGKGVPVVKHKEYGIYIPELIFGNLLTSSNYDDSQKRIVGGRNGLGATCAAIFSEKFIVETIDADEKLYYYQEFTNNMYDKSEPIIKKTNNKSYTKISFIPDRKRLGKLTDDTISLIKKRVLDTSACTSKNISIYLNENKMKEKDFQSYTNLYTNENKFITESYTQKLGKDEMVWDIGIRLNENYEQVSFVNGIDTYQGGKHVDYVTNYIIKKLTELISTKKKVNDIKPSYLRDKLFVIVRSTIINPSFTSQSKEYLNTNVKDFGMKIDISEKFINKIYKSGIVDEVLSFVKYKNEKDLVKKTENTSRKSRINVPKLDDANFAGTSKSSKCVLMLTEGDSAKTFAVSGTSVIGRDYYGNFALKGKVLNVREATQKQLLNNEEINNLKKIIGLQHNKKYTSVEGLRYGKIMILTDADYDGHHISGLVMNFFHTWWPELLNIKGFITSMRTPIIKVSKGQNIIEFYSQNEYEKWKQNVNIDETKWKIKYYKGLGTSTAQEAKELFKKMDKNVITYIDDNKKKTNDAILLAFEKKKADDRKEWLKNHVIGDDLDYSITNMTYDDFVNKKLVQFSMEDIHRSIPSIFDGLKPSQRKVLYTMFKKNYSDEIKVAQFAAVVSKETAYHHGEASLYSTIINMAQDYTGSNNINLLKPNGQFGCLDPETEILLYNGDIKKAKDITLEDKLLGDDGNIRNILALTQGVDDMYEITNSIGDTFIANSQHILTFKVKCHKKVKWDNSKLTWYYLYYDIYTKHMCKTNIFPKENHDPFTSKDNWSAQKYADKLFGKIPNIEYVDISIQDYLKLDDFTKIFLSSVKNKNKLRFSTNIINDAFIMGQTVSDRIILNIPRRYMICDSSSRIKFLQGFLDDRKHKFDIYQNLIIINIDDLSKIVIKQIRFIIDSLGCVSILGKNNHTLLIKGENIKIIYDNFFISNYIDSSYSLSEPHYHSITIKYLGKGPFVGWEVDKNHRFLLANFIVTHNSRLHNGKDAASPRYIFTEINEITKTLFNHIDSNVLEYNIDDGLTVEPKNYIPVIPMVLVNGCQGIGTGFSTFIPSYNI
ncbi:MAG: hypothetical protein RLZZ546_2283, partial [Bacteroidota bacterium]